MPVNTTGTLTVEQKEYYDRTLIKRALPELVYQKYGQERPIEKNSGQTISFRKFNSLPAATQPLTEGVTPTGATLEATKILAKLEQYGDFISVSDVVQITGFDPVLTESAELMGEQAGLTIDVVTRDKILIGTNVMYAGGKQDANSLTGSDLITSEVVKKAARHLKNYNTRKFPEGFIGIIDPDTSFDLQKDPLWIDVQKYSNGGKNIIDGEVGKIGSVRFIETTNVLSKKNSGGVKVHSTLIFGKDAYGVVNIGKKKGKKKAVEFIYHPAGSGGTSDPLNQRATTGWKALYATVILNQMGIVRLEHACSE